MSLTCKSGRIQVILLFSILTLLIAGTALWLRNRDTHSAPTQKPDLPARVHVAVASNFLPVHDKLVERFETQTGCRVITSSGSTGNLYAQIRNGAPHDLFLAADTQRPQLLVEQGFALRESLFTYATGRLALYVPAVQQVSIGLDWLKQGRFQYFAIANPEIAPYGAAAREALIAWNLWSAFEERLVRGENIAQTFQFIESGAAEAGLVSLSQVQSLPSYQYWTIPQSLHQPIRQDAVLLLPGKFNPCAREFLEFLKTDTARDLIQHSGYSLP